MKQSDQQIAYDFDVLLSPYVTTHMAALLILMPTVTND